jgi:galactokinase
MPPPSGVDRVVSLFRSAYGDAPSVVGSAPGRVNLIGEHLDYNGGPVLPFAIDRRIWVAAGPGEDFLLTSSAPGHAAVRRTAGPRQGDWSDYVIGVVEELRRVSAAPRGARIAVVSDIPPGAGLSSSAALSVAAAAALGRLTGWTPDPEALAEIAFHGEHDYVGVRCGRMDQTIIAHGAEGTAMFFETATGARHTSPFPLTVWIVPTGVQHALAGGAYNARRSECERALDRCRERWPGLASLAALEPDQLAQAMTWLPPPLGRRARHVVTETARSYRAKRALDDGDLAEVGRLLTAGHGSLQADFESSVPEADVLVAAAVDHGAYGARLTGAGWGGSVILLIPEEKETEVLQGTLASFERRFDRVPSAWSVRASAGARIDFVA